ncbi:MAG: sugar phosphate isomerase/epimerase [Nanoarchaeota archaeon]|nr:sugar phosphate isomerase/epimerase [Nanoarchaeota archaeon]
MEYKEKDSYHISDIYQGGYSSFSPSYGDIFTGYRTSAQNIGMTTDARTSNIVKEVSGKIGTGVKQIELSTISVGGAPGENIESIPKGEFKELKRLMKITGVDISMHAPIIEPSGLSRDGFSEENREGVERQIISAVEKGHELNPEGNIPITFHSSAMIPQQVTPKNKEFPSEVYVINSESGETNKFPLKESYFTGEKTDINNELAKINEKIWQRSLSNLSYNYQRGAEYVAQYSALALPAKAEKALGKELTGEKERAISTFNAATAILNDSYRELKEIYDQAYKYGNEEQKKQLDELRKKIGANIKEVEKEKDPTSPRGIELRQEIIGEGFETLNKLFPLGTGPEIYKPLSEFAKGKTTETFANVAFDSYKKYGENSPIISIENPPAGGAFSTAEELRDVVEKAREKFVEKAVESGMSKSEAKKAAEKTLGITWDVGHINMLRKYGYETEDLIKQAEIVAPLVKHVHLSDNFGFEHTELPMGMGNVPIKEIMQKLEKEGFKGKKVIEAIHWWQHFSDQGKVSPFLPTLQAFGTPIYSTNVAPYWNQSVGFEQGYYSGQGPTLPQINYETFGGGFSQLPSELGGQRGGGQGGRMSGRPME